MFQGYNHTGITVSDLDRSIQFYTTVLGMTLGNRRERRGPEIERGIGIPGIHLKIADVWFGENRVELVQYVSHSGQKIDPLICNTGTAHIGFSVKDMDKVYEELKAKGVVFQGEPTELNSGRPRKIAYFRDPDGITLELVEVLEQ